MRDPASIAAPILPQLDLTALADRQGQLTYQLNQQKEDKQNQLDADVIDLTNKIRENNNGWDMKFGQENYSRYKAISDEAVALTKKYNDPTDPRYIAERLGITRKLQDMEREMALQKEMKQYYDQNAKLVTSDREEGKISKIYKNKLAEMYQLKSAEEMTDFTNNPENKKILDNPWKPTALDIDKNVKEITEGIKQDTSKNDLKDADGRIITYGTKAYKAEVLKHIRQKSNELYEQVKDKNFSVDNNSEQPTTYGQKFKNPDEFYNEYFKDKLMPENEYSSKIDKNAEDTEPGVSGKYFTYKKNESINAQRSYQDVNGEHWIDSPIVGETYTPNTPLKIHPTGRFNIMPLNQESKKNWELLNYKGDKSFDVDKVIITPEGKKFVSGKVTNTIYDPDKKTERSVSGDVLVPYDDVNTYFNTTKLKGLYRILNGDIQTEDNDNQNTNNNTVIYNNGKPIVQFGNIGKKK